MSSTAMKRGLSFANKDTLPVQKITKWSCESENSQGKKICDESSDQETFQVNILGDQVLNTKSNKIHPDRANLDEKSVSGKEA